MLTPGEFVMSRGAVNMFGVDTMMAMNKAGGGTNRPKFGLISGYPGGWCCYKTSLKKVQALLDALVSCCRGNRKKLWNDIWRQNGSRRSSKADLQ